MRFSRRAALGSAAASASLLALSAPARAAMEVRVSAITAPNSSDEAMWYLFRDRLAERVGDAVEIVWLIRGELGGEEAIATAIRRNRVQISGLSLAGSSAMVPELSLLTAPYLFDSEAEIDFVLDNYLNGPLGELVAAKGLKLLRWISVGWTNIFSTDAILLPEDTQDRRLRAAASMAAQEFLAAVGADVTYLPFSDIIPSLQTGLIDGGATSVVMYSQAGLLQEAKHFTLTRHQYDLGIVMANRRWWDGLPDDTRAAIEASLFTSAEHRQATRAGEAELVAGLEDRGVELHRLSAEQRSAWRAAAEPATAALIDRIGGDAPRLYEIIQEGRAAFAAQNG